MLHALFLLAFMAVAAPLAAYIPLAALAGLLATVAWNMAEKRRFATLRASRGDAVVLLGPSCWSSSRDLTEASSSASASGAALFTTTWPGAVEAETSRDRRTSTISPTRPDRPRTPYDAALASDPDIVVYRISGAFFFGGGAKSPPRSTGSAHPKRM